MKSIKIKFLTMLIFIFAYQAISTSVLAQSPDKLSYQAVIRNAGGVLVQSSNVGIKTSVLQTTSTGTLVYSETHLVATNANGLATLEIGGGTPVSGTFTTIDWSAGPYFLKTETDPTGGTTYSIVGTSELLSVPYALHAKAVASYPETDPVFVAHAASGVTSALIGNWNTAYGWGNHASAGYLTSFTELDPIFGAWNKSTGISITASQVSDFQTTVTNNAAVLANTAKNSYPTADQTKLAEITGTNTGDETAATIKTKLGITTLSGSNTGDQDIAAMAHTNRTALDAVSGINTGDQTLSGLGGVASNTAITGATKTKITYDTKGLVTSGTDATTADIAASSDKNYITNAQLTVIGNTSGTNSGDNATNTQYSGLVTNATHTGDATGATALTVVGINGTSLAGLETGILKNTTSTGVPSIAVAGTDYLTPTSSAALLTNFPILNQNTTGNAATVTTNADLAGEVTSIGNAATIANKITMTATAPVSITGSPAVIASGAVAISIAAATPIAAGSMSASDKTKLDGIATTTHTIGESYQGGIIFWLDATGQHGLIAATTDQSTGIQWYNGTFRYTGTTGDGLYAGAMNTAMIVATQMADNQTGNFAAKVCADYSVTVGGVTYGDWYLPSIYELNLLLLQKAVVGGFANANYWGSTEFNNLYAFGLHFNNGFQFAYDKSSPHRVRAVRAF